MTMNYRVGLKKTREGYAVWVPGIPGCWSQGKTRKEAIANIKDALTEYLAVANSLTRGYTTTTVKIAV